MPPNGPNNSTSLRSALRVGGWCSQTICMKNASTIPAQIVLSIVVVWVAGCGTMPRAEMLETTIRDQEDTITQLELDLSRTRAQLLSARRESDALQQQIAKPGAGGVKPEQVKLVSEVESLNINRLLSGGHDTDANPGDDTLHVVLEPLDIDGDLLKVPGEFEIELRDGKRNLGHWKYSSVDSLSQWKSVGLTRGFVFDLPVHVPSTATEPIVVARLKTPDGRRFSAEQSVRFSSH